jgi:hypothetical protein
MPSHNQHAQARALHKEPQQLCFGWYPIYDDNRQREDQNL